MGTGIGGKTIRKSKAKFRVVVTFGLTGCKINKGPKEGP